MLDVSLGICGRHGFEPMSHDREEHQSLSNALVPITQPQRAAAYVRMSTDQQQYSIENQLEVIKAYAAPRDIELVRTYSDPGKSGLDLKGRKGLQQLLSDVCQQTEEFELILVQDISRWGRFQDTDEAAHYEYICRRAGYPVHYCSEAFVNDGSAVSAIVKSIKRVMAGEFSRELSVKLTRAKRRLAKAGYRQCGFAGLGLRRMVVDANGNPKQILEAGEYKYLKSDRVTLVAGPESEVEVVKSIFQLYAEKKWNFSQIARHLNNNRQFTVTGSNWTPAAVRTLLRQEKYIGTSVYNRTSVPLKTKRIKNPQSEWIRVEGAYEPIVDRKLFEKAQKIMSNRRRFYSTDIILKNLEALFRKHGRLSRSIIRKSKSVPSEDVYIHRFGSLRRAYELVGYDIENEFRYIQRWRTFDETYRNTAIKIQTIVRDVGGVCVYDPKKRLMLLNDEIVLVLSIAKYKASQDTTICTLAQRLHHNSDVIIGVQLDREYSKVLAYYAIPSGHFPNRLIRLSSERLRSELEPFRHTKLDFLAELAGRRQVDHE